MRVLEIIYGLLCWEFWYILWVIVWREVVIYMGYCVACGCNLLWVVVWGVGVIFYG